METVAADYPRLIATTEKLVFEETEHKYVFDGRTVPSVTQILSEFGMVNTEWFEEEHRRRGSAVHLCCELDDSNDLDEESVDERVVGYLNAYRRFRSDLNLSIKAIEQSVVNTRLMYAGRLDRICSIHGQHVLLDLKTGNPSPAAGLQLAGYAGCFEKPQEFRRFAVQIKADGTYRATEFKAKDYTRDWAVFSGLCAAYHWKQECL